MFTDRNLEVVFCLRDEYYLSVLVLSLTQHRLVSIGNLTQLAQEYGWIWVDSKFSDANALIPSRPFADTVEEATGVPLRRYELIPCYQRLLGRGHVHV